MEDKKKVVITIPQEARPWVPSLRVLEILIVVLGLKDADGGGRVAL